LGRQAGRGQMLVGSVVWLAGGWLWWATALLEAFPAAHYDAHAAMRPGLLPRLQSRRRLLWEPPEGAW
jgi:hypothetical protein